VLVLELRTHLGFRSYRAVLGVDGVCGMDVVMPRWEFWGWCCVAWLVGLWEVEECGLC
jgi:hypothetical protein